MLFVINEYGKTTQFETYGKYGLEFIYDKG
jgi:hypothetical protein